MKEITSVNNPLIANLIKLKNKKDRQIQKLYIIEGYHIVTEALKTDNVVMVLSSNAQALKNISCDTYLVTEQIIKKLSSSVTPQEIVAVVKMIDNKIDYDRVCKALILDNISDPGNLGTLVRTCASLGFDTIFLSEESVDLYNDKVLRSTQGTIYKINIVVCDIIKAIKELKKHQIYVYGTSLHKAISIKECKHQERFALILGNEAHGVRDEVLKETNQNIIIPMNNDVESLNIAIAGAICMWELSK